LSPPRASQPPAPRHRFGLVSRHPGRCLYWLYSIREQTGSGRAESEGCVKRANERTKERKSTQVGREREAGPNAEGQISKSRIRKHSDRGQVAHQERPRARPARPQPHPSHGHGPKYGNARSRVVPQIVHPSTLLVRAKYGPSTEITVPGCGASTQICRQITGPQVRK
jgi:hypothetical protein